MADYRKTYRKGQRDGSKNVYKPTGKDTMWAGILGWTKYDAANRSAYDKGYRNGRANRKRSRN